jgi:type IV secretory pathway TrbL component
MKFPNYLISSLAVVGAFSLIIMACSADNSNSTNSVNSVGRYQISSWTNTQSYMNVIDTETGIVKTFVRTGGQGSIPILWNLVNTTNTQ